MSDHQSSLNTYDAIVIGSGISGLTMSLIMAKEGKKVVLFERDEDIAPLIRPYRRTGGQCSPGLHISGWMDEGEIISSFFKYLNVDDGVEKGLNQNGFVRVTNGVRNYHIPTGFEHLECALISYFPECIDAVKNYIRLIKELNDQSHYFNHQLTPAKNKHNHSEYADSANVTLKACMEQYHASQEFIDMVGALNYIFIGSKADEVPFSTHAVVVGGFYHSPGFISIDGINKLLSNFKRELTRYGVDLFVNSEVDEILVDQNRSVNGVKINNGRQYNAPMVIASFNPKLLNDNLKHNTLRSVYRGRLEEAENSIGLYVAFYKVDDKDNPVENFVYFEKELDITIAALVNHSGNDTIFSVFLADDRQGFPMDNEERKKIAQEKLESLEDAVYSTAPALKGKTVLLDFLKPWSFERYTKTINGSAYGIKQTVNSFGFQQKVPVQGLYLVGQAIYPGFLGSMISSFDLACGFFEAEAFWSKVINS